MTLIQSPKFIQIFPVLHPVCMCVHVHVCIKFCATLSSVQIQESTTTVKIFNSSNNTKVFPFIIIPSSLPSSLRSLCPLRPSSRLHLPVLILMCYFPFSFLTRSRFSFLYGKEIQKRAPVCFKVSSRSGSLFSQTKGLFSLY